MLCKSEETGTAFFSIFLFFFLSFLHLNLHITFLKDTLDGSRSLILQPDFCKCSPERLSFCLHLQNICTRLTHSSLLITSQLVIMYSVNQFSLNMHGSISHCHQEFPCLERHLVFPEGN